MIWRRIIICSLVVGATPLVAGFLAGMALPLLGLVETPAWHHVLRVWTIRGIELVVFFWLGWVQRSRIGAHVVAAFVGAWLVMEILSVGVMSAARALAGPNDLSAVAQWPFDLRSELIFAATACVGVVAGHLARRLRRAQ